MTSLGVAQYDEHEKQGKKVLCNSYVEAFQTEVFTRLGYPTRIAGEDELWKYINSQHESLFDVWFNEMLEGITQEELGMLAELLQRTARFTKEDLRRSVLPRGPLLHSLHMVRHIRYMFGNDRPTILEFGPGSGYLGALLLMLGYPYAGTDVTQAYYLYQNRLWNHITGGRVREAGIDGTAAELLSSMSPGVAVHIPWWEFAKLRPETMPALDCVTANHMVCEMHYYSRKFSMLLSNVALQRSPARHRSFIFQGWGLSGPEDRAVANRHFYDFGFTLVHNDHHLVALTPSNSPCAVGGLVYPPEMDRFPPVAHVAPNNTLTASVLQGREAIRGQKTVRMDQLTRIYADLGCTGGEDEQFWKLIGMQSRLGSQTP